jgi:nucleotide-binding universal stress UspA family protein
MPPLVDWEPLKRAARARPRKIIRDTLGGDPGVRIVTKTLIGNAAEALVDRSAGADLLVVGSRGLGGLKGMLLGSVGHHCAAHAHCPVVIVHPVPVQEARKPIRRTLSGSSAA